MTSTTHADIRTLEKVSIREFVEEAAEYLTGEVLDYGCGQQPYRDVVEAAGGTYHGYDLIRHPGNVSRRDVHADLVGRRYDAILCTQVTQYVHDLDQLMSFFHWLLKDGHFLVMTYVTNWQEIEPGDLHRHTKSGMTHLLEAADFEVVKHERRAEATFTDQTVGPSTFVFPLGYGVIAFAR